jgi:xylulokinase
MPNGRNIDVVLGIDIGTSSSKGVLVTIDGTILASAVRAHEVFRPNAGHVEMDAHVWWDEFVSISRELLDHKAYRDDGTQSHASPNIVAVGVSGMGPCVTLTDVDGKLLRPSILYGVDTRAVSQIDRLTSELGADAIVQRCGSALSTQAVGPKLAWIAENEPAVWARARKMFMPSSFLVNRLTGEYVLDHHSASQCTPMYDTSSRTWYGPWADMVRGDIDLPLLLWPGEIAGYITEDASTTTGIPLGAPVIAGTIDAWAEAVSVGAQHTGDLMLMYGTTMFLIATTERRMTSPTMWGTVGAMPGTYNLAGGMATSGAITAWLRELMGDVEFSTLMAEAHTASPGANGLLMLPYFAGERTPIADPKARGAIVGLTLTHTRGDLYRAALEATAFGVRHNIETFAREGANVERVIAVGGGTQGSLWPQIVSDVTGLEQIIPTVTIGASFGVAFLAASALAPKLSPAQGPILIEDWNPPESIISPSHDRAGLYSELFDLYVELYTSTKSLVHRLGDITAER